MTAKRGNQTLSKEHQRLLEPYTGMVPPWRKWGPYVCERSWGSVREDYSPDGCAWEFLTHDMARSKAYRWGEDGIAGICDRYQLLVFALAVEVNRFRDEFFSGSRFALDENSAVQGCDRIDEFKDAMQTKVDAAATQGFNAEWVRTQLVKSEPDYGVPANAAITASTNAGRIEVHVQYTVPISFPGYTYNYEFDHTVKSGTFLSN